MDGSDADVARARPDTACAAAAPSRGRCTGAGEESAREKEGREEGGKEEGAREEEGGQEEDREEGREKESAGQEEGRQEEDREAGRQEEGAGQEEGCEEEREVAHLKRPGPPGRFSTAPPDSQRHMSARAMISMARAAASVASAGLFVALLAGCAEQGPHPIALVGATIIDGSGGPARSDMVVVVHGNKIETVVPRAGFKIPKTALVVDVSATSWIIPGLIDAHAHTAGWALPRYVAFGVTTVRDLHSNQDSILSLARAGRAGHVFGPRIFTAGAMIDGVPATYSDATAVKNDDEARRAVDARIVAGVEYLKTYTRITPELLKAILDEAGNFRTTVAAHLGLTDAITAATMGVHSIEHMTGVPEATLAKPEPLYAAHRQGFFPGWTAFEKSWAGLDSAALARTAVKLAETRVVMVPTLGLHETFSRLDDPEVLASPDLKLVPDSELARWNVPDMIARAGWKTADFAAFRASRANQDLFLREFRSAGGTIAAGTDASIQMMVPGASEHDEMALLVAAGPHPRRRAAGRDPERGQAPGRRLAGQRGAGQGRRPGHPPADPLADIANTRKIDRVMLRGLLYQRGLDPDPLVARMALVRLVLGWMAVWLLFLVWESGGGARWPAARASRGGSSCAGRLGPTSSRRCSSRSSPALWFASLGHGGWWLLFGLIGLLVDWAAWMRVADMNETHFPPLVHVLLGGIRGAAAGGVLSLLLL